LYQSIFRGQQNNEKRFDKEEVDGEDLSTYPFLSNLRLNPVKCDLPSVIPDNVMSEAVAEALMDNDRSTTGAIGTAITKLNDLMRQCLLGTTMDPSLPQSSIDFDQVLLGVVTDIIKSSVQSLRSAQQSNLVKALEESPPETTNAMTGEGVSSKRMKSSSSSSSSSTISSRSCSIGLDTITYRRNMRLLKSASTHTMNMIHRRKRSSSSCLYMNSDVSINIDDQMNMITAFNRSPEQGLMMSSSSLRAIIGRQVVSLGMDLSYISYNTIHHHIISYHLASHHVTSYYIISPDIIM
jgi:hypothetical protein